MSLVVHIAPENSPGAWFGFSFQLARLWRLCAGAN
jgi:hypothetical protein